MYPTLIYHSIHDAKSFPHLLIKLNIFLSVVLHYRHIPYWLYFFWRYEILQFVDDRLSFLSLVVSSTILTTYFQLADKPYHASIDRWTIFSVWKLSNTLSKKSTFSKFTDRLLGFIYMYIYSEHSKQPLVDLVLILEKTIFYMKSHYPKIYRYHNSATTCKHCSPVYNSL